MKLAVDQATTATDSALCPANGMAGFERSSSFQQPVTEAHKVMAEWTGEDGWCLPYQCSLPFGIRALSPNVVEHLVRARHFSARDLRTILERIRSSADHRDAYAAYNAILDITERKPWLWPHLETLALSQRTHDKPHVRRNGNNGFVLAKFPLHKMRLDLNKHLLPRVPELAAGYPTDPELGFAAFAEFAVQQYFQITEGRTPREIAQLTWDATLSYAPLDYLRDTAAKNTTPEHWVRFGTVILDATEFRSDIKNSEKLGLLRTSLDGLFKVLSIDYTPAVFEAISLIAAKCAILVQSRDDEASSELLETLGTLGISLSSQTLAPTRLKILRQAFDNGSLVALLHSVSHTAEIEKELAEVRAQIADASAKDEFDLVSTLSASAKELKGAAAEQLEIGRQRLAGLKKFVDGPDSDLKEFANLFDIAEFNEDVPAIGDEQFDELEADQLESENEHYDLENDEKAEEVDDCASDYIAAVSAPEDEVPSATNSGGFELIGTPLVSGEVHDELPFQSTATPFREMDDVQAVSKDGPFEVTATPESAEQFEMEPGDFLVRLSDTVEPISEEVLIELISRDLLGIAADGAEAFEAVGTSWPIEASVLRAAAAARTSLREYGADTQRFLSMFSRAESEQPGALGSAMLVGAIIRPAIMSRQSSFRSGIEALAYGTLGTYLQESVEAISALEFDFPPSTDELARLTGSDRVPQKRRLVLSLGEWCDAFARKTSRWPFATLFMHHQVSPIGLIGEARAAIEAEARDALPKARAAIDGLGTAFAINASAIEFDSTTSKPGSKLHPKGLDYLFRQFDEPLGVLDAWIRATEADGAHGRQSEARLRATVGNLLSRLSKAANSLRLEQQRQHNTLEGTVAGWIAARLDEATLCLEGGEPKSFATLDEATTADRDFLPAIFRDDISDHAERALQFMAVLNAGSLPDLQGAIEQACGEGAFETAARIADRFNVNLDETLKLHMATFATKWLGEIEGRKRSLKTFSRVDYSHQEEIERRLNWCETTILRLESIRSGEQVDDLADIPSHVSEVDAFADLIAGTARAAQRDRINQYRTDQNSVDADLILESLDNLTLEAIEDRIAQLRDGRSAAIFESEFDDVISSFTPSFVVSAASSGWPKSLHAYRDSLDKPGPLYIEEDRRAASLSLISHYLDVVQSINGGTPAMQKVRGLFEEIGFENVKTHEATRIGSSRSWEAGLSAEIRSDGWFLPPIFGSRSTGKFTLVLVAPDTLPEAVMKCLSAESPAILLLSGVADLARRREFAERLRANAIPALFIDEALVAFAATRRDTRARTIFECGLPYGRITPYVTDAGAVPKEMFFGRKDEIRFIMSKNSDGCLVYGGRQLGKSALLNHIEATRHDPASNIIVVKREHKTLGNAEKASEIWSYLKAMLPDGIVKPASRDAESIGQDIRLWHLKHPEGRIICMFDESDNFMAADTQAGYPELSRLKVLMEDSGRAFKVIFAGTHNVQRMHKQPNSPLAHLGNPICIGPLNRSEDDKRAAYELIIAPMKAAGFRFESIQAVEEILAWANYYPSLIQEYAKGLLASLHGAGSGKMYRLHEGEPLWVIPTDILFAHIGFQAIAARVRVKFHWTLELDPRYALVAYTLARLNLEGNEDRSLITGSNPADLLEEVLVFWPKNTEQPSLAAFEALLEEMFDLGVLGRVRIESSQRFRYLLRTQQVAAMLGSRLDIDHALLEFAEKDPTISYDRSIYRRRYRVGTGNNQNEWPYSPLTDLQVERIVSASASGVQIVCGLEILGLHHVGKAIKYLAEKSIFSGDSSGQIAVVIADQTSDLRRWIDGRALAEAARTLVIYTPSTARNAIDLIKLCDTQPKIIAGEIRPLILLDAADRDMRALAVRRKDQAQFLEAWGGKMIRAHMHQIECTQLDRPKLRDDILHKTGGIPLETIKLIKAMELADNPDEILRSWSFPVKFSNDFVKGPIGQALRLIETAEDDDYDALDDLIRGETHHDLITLGPDLVATGLVLGWNPKSRRIRRSAFGDFVAQNMVT
jgi:hypothetical protein